MSALIDALDNHTPLQLGENGHLEYGWSQQLREKILQFFFQLVRTDTPDILSKILYDILNTIKQSTVEKEYLKIMFCMLLQTRDILGGKGEYALSYMMLYTFHRVYPKLAMCALRSFVITRRGEHPYGSWKDMKCAADYFHRRDPKHPLIGECVKLINDAITNDVRLYRRDDAPQLSLCAKWVPRETSKYSWFFKLLARDWAARTGVAAAVVSDKKIYMTYRKIIAALNRKLDTVQIKQCGRKWADIDHNKTTSITLLKNKKAFLNVRKNGEPRSYDLDRVLCAENFKQYISGRIVAGGEIKGGRIGLEKMTEAALSLIYNKSKTSALERDMLNSQWRDNSAQTAALGKMIAMVDVSSSMEGSPMLCAIALGIRVAEKSCLGKRVLTFAEKPTWHNLEDCDNFIDTVASLKRANWGGNTNFRAAYRLILDALKEKNVPREDVRDLVLVVFSDMQMDMADRNYETLYKEIEREYTDTGYDVPHMLFWNLRGTDGFPTVSTQKNASMLSGYSAAFLNDFCEKGVESLKDITPWDTFTQTLQKYFEVFDSVYDDVFGVELDD